MDGEKQWKKSTKNLNRHRRTDKQTHIRWIEIERAQWIMQIEETKQNGNQNALQNWTRHLNDFNEKLSMMIRA